MMFKNQKEAECMLDINSEVVQCHLNITSELQRNKICIYLIVPVTIETEQVCLNANRDLHGGTNSYPQHVTSDK